MAVVKYNLDDFNSACNKVDEIRSKLEEDKTNAVNAFDELRKKGWKTKAGAKYMSEMDAGWVPTLNKYINILERLDRALKDMRAKYAEMDEKVRKIDF